MTRTLLIEDGPGEVRAAIARDGEPIDLLVERSFEDRGHGNVYLGRVTKVDRALDAAFVDIGREEAGFLPGVRSASPVAGQPIHEGAAVVVQVDRSGAVDKAPRLTARIRLAGHRLIFRAAEPGIVVGRRIGDPDERRRLAVAAAPLDTPEGGYILRHAASGATAEVLAAEAAALRRAWAAILEARARARPPALLHRELPPVERILRDHVTAALSSILIDGRQAAASARSWCERFRPELVGAVAAHSGRRYLFAETGMNEAFQEALEAEVTLPSGGTLFVEPTRALTAIDVDTGRHGAPGAQERAILATNLEAAAAVARQVRLRNVAGLIVVDFVHMRDRAHRRRIGAALRDAMADDPMPLDIGEITRFGLLEMTRRRERPSLAELMLEPPFALGRRNATAVAVGLLRSLHFEPAPGGGSPLIRAAPDVIAVLEGQASAALVGVCERLGRPVRLVGEPGRARESAEIEWR